MPWPRVTVAPRDGVHCDSGSGPLSIEFRLARNPATGKAPGQPAAGPGAKAAAPAFANRRDVSGVVLDPDSKPVRDATVRWGPGRSDETIEAKSGDDGKFRLAHVPSEHQQLCVIPARSDLAPGITPIPGSDDQEVRVVLAKGHAVRGVVCDERGTPFAGVNVLGIVAIGDQRGLVVWERKTETDETGRFVVEGMPAGNVTFTFLGHGVSDLRDHPLNIDGENRVVMTASGAIRGKVVDQDNNPVRSFRVLLNIPRLRLPDDKLGGYFAGFCGIGLSYTTDDGSFLVRNLTGGSVQRVTVLAPGHGECSIDRVAAGPFSHLVPPILFRLPPAYTLLVHAIDEATGKPIPNARVGLVYDDPAVASNFAWGYNDTTWGDSVHARTDAAGVATFSPLTFGEAVVLVQAAGHARQLAGWGKGERDITLKLPRGRRLRRVDRPGNGRTARRSARPALNAHWRTSQHHHARR